MATAYERVTSLMATTLKRAKDAIAQKGLAGEVAERVRVRERLAGLEQAVKELARVVDRHKAEEERKARTQ